MKLERRHNIQRYFPLIALIGLIIQVDVKAQEINATASTIHDENIFNIHTPTSDQITQLQGNVANSWDMDRSSIYVSYTGAVSLFRDLDARNFHVHLISLNSIYHLSLHEQEEREAGADDSVDSGTDSLHLSSDGHLRSPGPQAESSDSLDQL